LEIELESARSQVAWLSRQLFGQKAERLDPSEVERQWNKFNDDLEAKANGSAGSVPLSEPSASLQLVLHLLGEDGRANAPESTTSEATTTAAPEATTGAQGINDSGAPEAVPGHMPGTTDDAVAPAAGAGDEMPGKRRGHGRRKLPETLSTRYILLEPDEIPEGASRIGDKVSERLGIVPRHLERVVIVRPIYAITEDVDGQEETRTFKADPPSEMIPGGLFTPTALAHVIAERFLWHTPWTRLTRKFAADGFVMPKSTLAGVSIRAAALAEHLVTEMLKHARVTAPALYIDPTGVRYLDQDVCKKGAAWIRVAIDVGVFVDFSRDLNGKIAEPLLAGWQCPIVADGAQTFDRGVEEHGLERGGCWSHARRKLVYVCPMDPRALAGIAPITKLFEIEAEIRDLDPDRRLKIRRERSAPIVQRLFAWRDEMLSDPRLPHRGEFAKALRYLRNQAERLTLFLRDGRVFIHNNLAELGGRHIAVGRHNWTFLGSDEAAAAAGIWITLVLSAAMHRIEPERYLRDLFRVLPDWPQTRLLELAPHAWAATRARLDQAQLTAEYGPINIPPKLDGLELSPAIGGGLARIGAQS
jgi:transposase